MISRSQLKFHETFQPEAGYITSVLELAAENYRGNKYQISDHTGIPTGKQKGKVEPSIKYASFMGLIGYQLDRGVYALGLTDLGKEVFAQDKYLHEDLTKWLCHYHLSHQASGAAQWAYIVHGANCGFVSSASSDHLLQKANQEFGLSVSFDEMFGVVKRSYVTGLFSSIGFLEWTDMLSFCEHIESPELIYAYGYALLNSWEKLIPGKKEITMNEVEENIGLGRIYGLPADEINCALDSMANEGIISVNRQLFPVTVVRAMETKEIVDKLYSRLL